MRRRKEQTAIYELSLALRLTQEYVGDDLLPRRSGWSWFDALTKHAPEMLKQSLSSDMPANVQVVAGLLSTIDFQPSQHHPVQMEPMARQVIRLLTEDTPMADGFVAAALTRGDTDHIPDERPGSLDAPWMEEPDPPGDTDG